MKYTFELSLTACYDWMRYFHHMLIDARHCVREDGGGLINIRNGRAGRSAVYGQCLLLSCHPHWVLFGLFSSFDKRLLSIFCAGIGAKINKNLTPRTRWDVMNVQSQCAYWMDGHSGEAWPEWGVNQTLPGWHGNRKIFTKRMCLEWIQSFLTVSYLLFYLCLLERRNK